MILYDYAPAPNPRRVRYLAAEKQIELQIVTIDLGNQEQLAQRFR